MDGCVQGFGSRRMFGTAIEVPDLRLVQRAKLTFLCFEVKDVLVQAIDHSYRSVPERLEDAIFLQSTE